MSSLANPLDRAVANTRSSIKWLNSTHEFMALWLIANPAKHQRELAEEIGYTEAWVSTVIHSDMFQAQYRELCGEYQQVATHGLGEAINAAAFEALDALREKIRNRACSEQFLLGSAKTLLAATGYGAPKVAESHVSHTHLHVSATELMEARAKMNARFAAPVNEPALAVNELELEEA